MPNAQSMLMLRSLVMVVVAKASPALAVMAILAAGLVHGSELPKGVTMTPAQEKAAILNVATAKLDELLGWAAQAKPTYGFQQDDSFDQVDLGDPIPIYTVDRTDAGAYTNGQPVNSILKKSGNWLVPVNVAGSFRVFIRVDDPPPPPNGDPTDIFVARLESQVTSRIWKKMTERWPASKNFHPKFVVCPGIPGYYFTVPELPNQNMTDTIQLVSEMDGKQAALSPAEVILRSWR